MSTFESLNPVTGESIASHAIASQADVNEAVAAAREVFPYWQAMGFKGRKKALLQWNSYLLENIDDLVEIVSLDTAVRSADFLYVAAPLTAASHYLIGRKQLDQAKAGQLLGALWPSPEAGSAPWRSASV